MTKRPEDSAEGSSVETVEFGASDFQSVRRFTLTVLEGPDAGASFTSSGDRIVVGTHKSVDFRLGDRNMSRFHCEIELGEGKPRIRDLDSLNGTYVDSVQIRSGFLHEGANLRLGKSMLRFEQSLGHHKIALSSNTSFGYTVGHSPSMRRLFALLEQIAPSTATILLQGETGVGKDLLAESIHFESPRKNQPFVVVDCASLPSELLTSELFGHVRGAFTGADSDRKGAFELANGGTVFLDEIGELDIGLQPTLLRVLEQKTIRPVGGKHDIPVDVRVIAATTRNLRREVNAKRFRSDLYFRLAVVELFVPPLRERRGDIPFLVEAILARFGDDQLDNAHVLKSEKLVAEMAAHAWPGNVRELRNFVERFLALGESARLFDSGRVEGAPNIDTKIPWRQAREQWLDYFERTYLGSLLEQHGGNVSAAARAAGIDRMHYHRMLKRRGLS
jgi:transcriptional regulator with PAS, ATPase and Fis domain